MTRRGLRWTIVAAAAAVLTAVSAPASAHPDEHLPEAALILEPGESWSQGAQIHFHRLVGTVTSSSPITLRVGPAPNGGAHETVVSGTATFNRLVPCCPGMAWADVTVQIENRQVVPAAVTTDLAFVHDDLAVVVLGEEGAVETLAILLLAGAVTVRGALRPPAALRSRRYIAIALITAATVATVAFSGIGRARYGGDAVEGLVASAATLVPFPTGPFLSGLAVVMGLILACWWAGAILWSRSIGSGRPDPTWWPSGIALAGSAVMSGWLVTQTYGPAPITGLLTLAATAPPLAVLVIGRRRSRSAALAAMSART